MIGNVHIMCCSAHTTARANCKLIDPLHTKEYYGVYMPLFSTSHINMSLVHVCTLPPSCLGKPFLHDMYSMYLQDV